MSPVRYYCIMKTILIALIGLGLSLPLFAGPRHEGTHHSGSHFSGNHWGHERHEGFRGNHRHFNGFGGTFYGQIIILDDGCYFWDGLTWEYTDVCD